MTNYIKLNEDIQGIKVGDEENKQSVYADDAIFLCPRQSKNGGGALSVTPVRACVRSCVRPSVRPLSNFGVRSKTFERLHRFDSNLVCLYKTQVKFDLGYNPLIFDGVMGLL